MKIKVSLLLLILSITVQSQTSFNSEGFEVTKQDIELNVYDKDSLANALVIYEFGKSFVDKNSFLLQTEVKRKLKILNRKGFDKATETVYLYRNGENKEKISDIKAIVYNSKDGKVTQTQLAQNAVFEEQYNDNYTLVKFTFPNIQEGSVINYSYTLTSPFMFKYKSWHFQDDIPKLHSEYQPSIPGNWEYNIKLVGGKKLHTNESKLRKHCLQVSGAGSSDCGDYMYVMKNIPAFTEEDYMTTKENYLARIEYELKVFRGFDGRVDNITKTWKTTENELKNDNNIGKQLKKSNVVKDLLNKTILDITDPLTKASAIFKYVQQNYLWNGEYKIFNNVSIKNLVKHKSGNVSEINILLHNLLDANDIQVNPVLMSTRSNGLATRIHPVISDFNYLIVQANIGDKTYLLDATDDYLSFGQLPFRCLNQYGRLLDFKEGGYWVDIAPSALSTITYNAELTLNNIETISAKLSSKARGYHALRLKKSYFENSEGYLNNYKEEYPNLEFLNHNVHTEDKTNLEFTEEFIVNLPSEIIGQSIYIDPFLLKFFSENPFKLQERSYPIDFGYKDAYSYAMKIDIPKSYEVKNVPDNISVSLPDGKGKLTLTSNIEDTSVYLYLRFNFTEAIYSAAYYNALKSFFSKVVDVQKNSLIVLSKK